MEKGLPFQPQKGMFYPPFSKKFISNTGGGFNGDGKTKSLSISTDSSINADTSPWAFNKGPPELPGLIAASVWIKLTRLSGTPT